VIEVKPGDKSLGTIKITSYKGLSWPVPDKIFDIPSGGFGVTAGIHGPSVDLTMVFSPNSEALACFCRSNKINWKQWVIEDTEPGRPKTPYEDPPSSIRPFYNSRNGSITDPLKFQDQPWIDPKSFEMQKAITIKFVTHLVCVKNGGYESLAKINWGFEVTKTSSGKVNSDKDHTLKLF